jgi:hypothetical protein
MCEQAGILYNIPCGRPPAKLDRSMLRNLLLAWEVKKAIQEFKSMLSRLLPLWLCSLCKTNNYGLDNNFAY